MIRKTIYKIISHYIFPNKGVTHIKREPRLIVSLTSYPRRINVVPQVINSLLRQSLKPDMVILWLAENEFPERERNLPKTLLRYVKFGLTIKWCHNIRSYKKIIPALYCFPNDVIVTADDDSIYPEYWLERLYSSYLRFPNEVHCHHAFRIKLDEYYKILGRENCTGSGPLKFNEHAVGIGGILYPPHLLPKESLNESTFMSIAPTDDDMWLWAMERIENVQVRLVEGFTKDIVCIDEVQSDGLVSINSAGEGGRQFANLLNKFPILKEGLLKDK